MQLRGASMAILGVGATMALLNMAFHPLARMGALTHDASDLRAHSHRNRTRGAPGTCCQWRSCDRWQSHGTMFIRHVKRLITNTHEGLCQGQLLVTGLKVGSGDVCST